MNWAARERYRLEKTIPASVLLHARGSNLKRRELVPLDFHKNTCMFNELLSARCCTSMTKKFEKGRNQFAAGRLRQRANNTAGVRIHGSGI
jgi:formylmethanofuran dehydrogenase subunit B